MVLFTVKKILLRRFPFREKFAYNHPQQARAVCVWQKFRHWDIDHALLLAAHPFRDSQNVLRAAIYRTAPVFPPSPRRLLALLANSP